MSLTSSESQALKPIDLVFILAIAGRIHAQGRILAQQLDEGRHIYYAYAVLDSLSCACTMSKYFCDLLIANNNSDTMHDLMMTPAGIIAISIESILLVSLSVLAIQFDNEQKDSYKKFIATAWPYVRDVTKGLKNAYKGWRSAVVAMSLIGGIDIKFLIAPIGLILGIAAAANRFWLRNMTDERKIKMKENETLLYKVKQLSSLTHDERKFYKREIRSQSIETRCLAYAAVAAGGFFDGMYLYLGVLGLVALSSPMLTAMASISAIYMTACVITRVYEEYDYQLRLLVLQTQNQLILLMKETETRYAHLSILKNTNDLSLQELTKIYRKKMKLCNLISKFEEKSELLKQQSNRSYLSAALLGIKNGLYAYGALASILFLIGGLVTLTGTAFPPLLLISSVLIGLVFIIGFTIHSLIENYKHLNKQENKEESCNQLLKMRNNILKGPFDNTLSGSKAFHASLKNGLLVKPSSQYFFQEWFEVFRSFFSGFGKGEKFAAFAGNPFQEIDSQGHYHETPVMIVLGIISAILFSITLALRALAKGLGRTQLGKVDLATNIEPVTIKSPPIKLRPDAPPSPRSGLRFFKSTNSKNQNLCYRGCSSQMKQDSSNYYPDLGNTTPGLN